MCPPACVQVRTVLRLARSAEAHFDYKHHVEALAGEEASVSRWRLGDA